MEKHLSDLFKRLGIVLLACMLLTLSACGSKRAIYARTQYYTVYSQNDQWFMKFHPERWSSKSSGNTNANIAVSFPEFRSLSDMQNRIKSGKIAPYELSGLYYQSTDHILTICNLNKLYDLVAPEEFSYSRIVLWGEEYEFAADSSSVTGSIVCTTADIYEQALKHHTDYISTQNRSVIAQTTAEDRNARIVYSKNKSSAYKDKLYRDIFYEIQTQTQTLYIRESSILEYLPGVHTEDALMQLDISNSVPEDVYIFGNNGTNCFYAELQGFTERPSVEWLSSFGLKPYTNPTPFIGIAIGAVAAGFILVIAGYREKRRRKQKPTDQ